MSTAATGTDDINRAPENNNLDDANVDLDAHDDCTGDATAQANVPAAPGGGPNGPTNFNLRVEQNKIPEFFGAKSKDTISTPTTGGSGQNKPMDGRPDLPPLRQLTPEPGTRMALIHSRLEHR